MRACSPVTNITQHSISVCGVTWALIDALLSQWQVLLNAAFSVCLPCCRSFVPHTHPPLPHPPTYLHTAVSYLLIADLFCNFFRYFVSKGWHEQCLWGGAAQVRRGCV